MDDVFAVSKLDALDYLPCVYFDLVLSQTPSSLNQVLECLVLAILHNDVDVLVILKDILKVDNVGAFEMLVYFNLAHEFVPLFLL